MTTPEGKIKKKIDIKYNHPVIDLVKNNNDKISGVITKTNNGNKIYYANSIILACGSFESNSKMRAKYLGERWRNVKLRGIPHNTGEGLEMAISHGAIPYDDWSTCHASPQDINRPDYDLPGHNKSGDYWSRYAYPFSVMVNINGDRFIDEGETWRGRSVIAKSRKGLTFYEPAVIRLRDGRYLAIIRTMEPPYTSYQSYSVDEGETWSVPTPVSFRGQTPFLFELKPGVIICTYRDMTPDHSGVAASVTYDEGVTWNYEGHIYEGTDWNCGYPSVVRLQDMQLLCVYYTCYEDGNSEVHGAFVDHG